MNHRVMSLQLFSIGHGSKKIAQFIEELRSFGVTHVVDVRSKPFSRWHPQYNRAALEQELQQHGIVYVFSGDAPGGRPADPACYDADGRIAYDRVKTTPLFQSGIRRLITAAEKKIPAAVLCSESNPEDCHRTRLIGRELETKGVDLRHITGVGRERSQREVVEKIRGKHLPGLFD